MDIKTLRELAGGLPNTTDEELVQAMHASLGGGQDFNTFARSVGYDPGQNLTRGFKIGLHNTGATLAGAGAAAADAVGWTGGRDAALEIAQRQAGKARILGRRSDDVDNFGEDPMAFLASAVGQAGAYAIPSLVTGGAGAGVGLAAGLGRAGIAASAAGGAYTGNLAQETGSIYNELAEQGKYEPGRALMFAAPAAALDTAAEAVPFLRPARAGGLLVRGAKNVGMQAGAEAVTETAQTAIERAGAYKDLLSDDAFHEYRNAAALGAVGGGVFGGVATPFNGPRQEPAPAPAPAAPPAPSPYDAYDLNADLPPVVSFSAPTRQDEGYLGFGLDDPHSIGDNPYGSYGLRTTRPTLDDPLGGPAFPEDILEPDNASVLYGSAVPYTQSGTTGAGTFAPAHGGNVTRTDEDAYASMQLGAELGRQRALEVQAAERAKAEKLQADAKAVAAKNAEFEAATQRARTVLGGGEKGPSPKQVELFVQLEKQREAGLVAEEDFVGDAALISQLRLGEVRKNIAARQPAAAPAAAPGANAAGVAAPANGSGTPVAGAGAGNVGSVAAVASGGNGSAAPAVASGAGAVSVGGVAGKPGGSQLSPVQMADAMFARINERAAKDAARTGRRPAVLDPGKEITRKVKRGGKMVEEVVTARQMVIDLLTADPTDAVLISAVTGIDPATGSVQEPMTLDQAAILEARQSKREKPMSRQAVQQRLSKYGIDADTASRISFESADTVTAEELGMSSGDAEGAQEAFGSGMRVESSLADAAGSGVTDVGTSTEDAKLAAATKRTSDAASAAEAAWRAANPEAASAALGTEQGKRDKATSDAAAVAEREDPTLGEDPEFVAKRQALAAQRAEADAALANSARARQPRTVQEFLARDLAAGDINEADIRDAAEDYEVDRDEGDPSWDDLNPREQGMLARLYANSAVGLVSPQDFNKGYKNAVDAAKQRLEGQAGRNALRDESGVSEGAPGAGGQRLAVEGGQGEVQGDPPAAPGGERGPARSVDAGAGALGTLPLAELQPVGRSLFSTPGFSDTLQRLRVLGLGDLIKWASTISLVPPTAPDGTALANGWVDAEFSGGQPLMHLALQDVGTMGEANARWVSAHEIGHLADATPFGGVYSTAPEMRFADTGAGVQPTGDIAMEIQYLHDNDQDGFWGDVFAYPMAADPNAVPDAATAQGELFAQLFALYTSPAGRAKMELDAPLAHAFMERAFNDLRTKKPPATAADIDAYLEGRRQAFRGTGQGKQVRSLAPAKRGDAAAPSRSVGRSAGAAVAQLEAARAAVQSSTPSPIRDAMTNIRDFFRKKTPWVLTNFQMLEQFGAKLPALRQFIDASDAMRVESTRLQTKFDDVAKRWAQISGEDRKLLDELALRATMDGVHPDLKADDKKNAHMTERQRVQHAELAKKWAALSPEAQRVYTSARDTMDSAYDSMSAAVGQLQRDYGLDVRLPDRMPGPYFPLLRFGEYLAIGESEAYKTLADQVEAAQGKTRKELQAKLDAMKRDPAHYVVSAHESRAAMEAAVKRYAGLGLDARSRMAGQRLDALPKDIHKMIADMAGKMAGEFDGATATAVIDAYKEMLLNSLPELHAMHRTAQRIGVEGASPDMLRAFAAGGRQSAFYTSRLMHAKKGSEALMDVKAQAKGDTDMEHVFRELEQRQALNLQHFDSPVQEFLGTLGWVYHLGVSPAFLAMNMTQPLMATTPLLAGKYGGAKTAKHMGRAWREALQVLKQARWKDGKLDLWSGISEDSVPGESVSEDRKMLRQLMQRGIIDEGMQHELRMFAEGGSPWVAKFVRATGWASQQIELVNRVSTALATFRLARESGLDFDEATQEAYAVTIKSQMDYSQEGTARFMREGGGVPFARLVFQFRRYQQGMLYVIVDNMKKAAFSPGERKTALATLGYFFGITGLMAGSVGLPLAGTVMSIINAFLPDDDEDGDAETRLRNFLFDITGDREMATVLAKGLPAMFGADLSKRIGLGDIASPFPRLAMDAKTAEDNMGRLLVAIAGPTAGGLSVQLLQALEYFNAGDIAKGTERMVPKSVADVMKSYRYMTNGMTDRRGEEILGSEDFTAWELTLRALGSSSTKEANYYEGTRAKNDLKMAVEKRKGNIGAAYRAALRDGDTAEVEQMIAEFNEDHPSARITGKDRMEWRKLANKRSQMRDETGIAVDPRRDKDYEEVMRFAR